MGDGRASLTRLIRIKTSPYSLIERISETSPQEPSYCCRPCESVRQHTSKRRRNIFVVRCNHQESGNDVNHGHRGHNAFRHFDNPLDASENHRRQQQRKDKTRDPGLDAKSVFKTHSDVVALRHIAAAEATDHGRKREENAQPFHVEALLHDKHWPTDDKPLIIFLAVAVAEGDFYELGRHAKKSSHPHPKECSWPAKENCEPYPAYIPRSNRS